MRNKPLVMAVLAVLIALAQWALHASGLIDPWNRVAGDQKARWLPRQAPDPRIVIVTIDEASLAAVGEAFQVYWPWPREYHAVLVDYLRSQGAKLIAFDIFFDAPDADRLVAAGAESDQALAQALAEAGNVILAAHLPPAATAPPAPGQPLAWASPNHSAYPLNLGQSVAPLPALARAARGLGNTALSPDADGLIRRVRLLARAADGSWLPALSLAAYQAEHGFKKPGAGAHGLTLAGREIPLEGDGSLRVDWYGAAGGRPAPYTYLSYFELLQAAVAQAGGAAAADEAQWPLAGSYVLVGATAAGLSDLKATPISRDTATPGVEIHAHALNNLLDGRFLRSAPPRAVAAAAAGLALALLALSLWWTPRNSLPCAALLLGLAAGADAVLFGQWRVEVPTTSWLSAAVLAAGSAWLVRYWFEFRAAQQLKRALSCYVEPSIAEEAARNPDLLRLGGQRCDLTVSFSDLQGFTALSESRSAEQLIEIINQYFDAMTAVILDSGGTVDKFIGDAIMAFWGAPRATPDHAQRACAAVLRQKAALARFNEQMRARELPTLTARWGVNSGSAVVGNVGGHNRFNYTALGDTVNVAARLEPANVRYGSTAMISEFTYAAVRDRFLCRELGREVLKGKSQPLTLYELVADRSDGADLHEQEVLCVSFGQALQSYYAGDWVECRRAFAELAARFPGDRPTQKMLAQVEKSAGEIA